MIDLAQNTGDFSVDADELRLNLHKLSNIGGSVTVGPGLTVNVVQSDVKITPKERTTLRRIVYMSGLSLPEYMRRAEQGSNTLWEKLKSALPFSR